MLKELLYILISLIIGGGLLTSLYLWSESYILRSIHISVVSNKPSYILRMLLSIPTSVAIVLAYLLLHKKSINKKGNSNTEQPHTNTTNQSITKYFSVGEYTWQAVLHNNALLYVVKNPICKQHNLSFISHGTYLCCPEFSKHNCNSKISQNDLISFCDEAKSYIEKEIRESAIHPFGEWPE